MSVLLTDEAVQAMEVARFTYLNHRAPLGDYELRPLRVSRATGEGLVSYLATEGRDAPIDRLMALDLDLPGMRHGRMDLEMAEAVVTALFGEAA